MNFKHYPNRPAKLTKEFSEQELGKLIARVEQAEQSKSPQAWLDLYRDWNSFSAYYSGEASRIGYAHSADMANPEWDEADRYFREQVNPAVEAGNAVLLDAFLKSKYKDAIAKHYGNYLLEALETTVEPQAPVNSELRVHANDLIDQYEKLTSAGEVVVGGKTITLSRARGLQSHNNAETRKEAWLAYRKWFLDHHDVLAGIYDRLVQTRDEMGRNLGHDNYIPLGYLSMRRTDYGPEQAKAFRDSVRQYAVPILARLNAEQAEALGTETLLPWDVGYHPAFTLPTGIAPVDTQLEKAQHLFDELSPRLGAHFSRMRKEGLIDLENRKGKKPGAFATMMPDEERMAILCNSTGDEGDVGTLIHEMGHAFQGWESQKIEAVDLRWPTSDGAEIHSMGMEFLALPRLTWFFNPEDAKKYRRHHIHDAVNLMCYISVVDEFQHWVYENPNATPAERDKAWVRFSDTYMPGIDYTGYEAYKYARWYAQGHIFATPFYYIDYAIAQTAAMQLGMMDAEDHEKALNTYLKLCEIGGTLSILNIFRAAGLRSPFDPATMRDLMEWAAKEEGVEELAEAA
jgi:M3 family oligoendopeptidase